jgi:hypothetical protein
MKESLKKNWKGITATVVAFGAVFGAIYYVNCIYLPGRQQAKTTKLTATEPVTPKEYNYTVSTGNAQAADSSASSSSSSSTNPANDRIKVTTGGDGTVTIDRTWDAEPGELDTTTTSPSTPSANIGSGGGKITGTDGAYHGEQPTTSTPSTGSSDTATKKPSTSTESKPSTGTTTKPTTPSTSDSTTQKPSGGSSTGNSTPKDGDIRTENGKQQEYVDGFGWVHIGDGGQTNYIIGDPNEDLGAQVGEMG